jgi:arylsulfatase A-like enzyme/Flp pilus assembly protein TadD
MQDLHKFFSVVFLTAAMLAAANPGQAGKVAELNVLLITIDTLSADRLSCYSDTGVETPNIDRLAEKGILFTRAMAHTPTTLPSHANILLGSTPLYHGVHDNSNSMVKDEYLTLAEHLKARGYATGAFVGAYPLDSRFGLSQGFDVYDDDYDTLSSHKYAYGERPAEAVVDRSLAWLTRQKSTWFLWMHVFDPHFPYDPPEPFKSGYAHPHDGEVAYVDSVLGRLFDYLRDKGLSDRTVIVLTGDHGESLGEHGENYHGFFAYNATLWVPLIISVPGTDAGRVDQYVGHIDIFPTVCDILNILPPDSLQGISLRPALKNRPLPERALYIESLYPSISRGWAPITGIIRGGKKFLNSPIPELYDLSHDFSESKNLAQERELGIYRKSLADLVKTYSYPEKIEQSKRVDRQTLKTLASLGYISGPQLSTRETFGPEDDVKLLLPFYNRAEEARHLYEQGRVKESITILNRILKQQKNIDIAYTHLAEIYQQTGLMKEALTVLGQGITQLPSSYILLTQYTHSLISAGRHDEVIRLINDHVLPQMEYDAEIWNCLGVAYWNTGQDTKALDALENALDLDKGYANVYANLGAVQLSIFFKNKNQTYHRQAQENYRKALELDPQHVAAYNGLGYIYREAGKLTKAIEFWEKAMALNPGFSETIYNLSQADLDSGNKVRALNLLLENKRKYYGELPEEERRKLDAYIEKCMETP